MYTQLQQRESDHPPVTLNTLAQMRAAGEKIACITAYDASFATLVDAAGADVVLVGDSLGMVIQGHDTTVPVTMDQMVYHSAAVARGLQHAFLMTDLPFASYTSRDQALTNSVRLMQEGGARMVKLESGGSQLEIVEYLAGHDIAVCAHLGLKPQSVHKTGGFRVQGREEQAAARMVADARALEAAGADLLLLECIPAALGGEITRSVHVPVIGIGAGPDTDGQILVLYDVLDITAGRKPRFVRNFMDGAGNCGAAVASYVAAVRSGAYPHLNIASEPAPVMDVVTTVAGVRAQVRSWRAAGLRIALVPTMGNLHAGHMSLLALAAERAERVIVSIFVNPLQFGPAEDFSAYPRTLDEDQRLLHDGRCDLLFAPTVEQIYPDGGAQPTLITVRGLSSELCGQFRPGHFDGVATVVAKLFNIVTPDVAVFGEKDIQQFVIIRRMTSDLLLPVEVVGAPTVRAPDGLALSSRNRFLSAQERQLAPAIHTALAASAKRLTAGDRDFLAIESAGWQMLAKAGLRPDYFAVRDGRELQLPSAATREFVVLTAARLGKARLIDNLRVAIS